MNERTLFRAYANIAHPEPDLEAERVMPVPPPGTRWCRACRVVAISTLTDRTLCHYCTRTLAEGRRP